MIEPMTIGCTLKAEDRGMATKHNVTVAIEPGLHYTAAQKRAASLFSAPLPLGGEPLSREDLHERRRLR